MSITAHDPLSLPSVPQVEDLWLAAEGGQPFPATLTTYRSAITAFKHWRGEGDLITVTRGEAYAWVAWASQRWQPGGVAIRLRSLRALYGWLARSSSSATPSRPSRSPCRTIRTSPPPTSRSTRCSGVPGPAGNATAMSPCSPCWSIPAPATRGGEPRLFGRQPRRCAAHVPRLEDAGAHGAADRPLRGRPRAVAAHPRPQRRRTVVVPEKPNHRRVRAHPARHRTSLRRDLTPHSLRRGSRQFGHCAKASRCLPSSDCSAGVRARRWSSATSLPRPTRSPSTRRGGCWRSRAIERAGARRGLRRTPATVERRSRGSGYSMSARTSLDNADSPSSRLRALIDAACTLRTCSA